MFWLGTVLEQHTSEDIEFLFMPIEGLRTRVV